ncbi:MAG: 30S ribosomal protein S6 [Deltaproteobacteria bacterium]|nr:30S ribosomal protein S6 [Deltaproteobacteria bacterium]
MRKYETMLLLSPELAGDARESVLSVLTGVIEREGGKFLLADHWGMRDIAYPINKQTRGYYVRLEYLAPGKLIAELERNIRITEGIFRFVTVVLEEEAAAQPTQAGEAANV